MRAVLGPVPADSNAMAEFGPGNRHGVTVGAAPECWAAG